MARPMNLHGDVERIGALAGAATEAATAATVVATLDVNALSRTAARDADMADLGEYPAFDWAAMHGAIVGVHVTTATLALEHLTELAAAGGLNEAETAGLASLLSVDVTEANAILAAPVP